MRGKFVPPRRIFNSARMTRKANFETRADTACGILIMRVLITWRHRVILKMKKSRESRLPGVSAANKNPLQIDKRKNGGGNESLGITHVTSETRWTRGLHSSSRNRERERKREVKRFVRRLKRLRASTQRDANGGTARCVPGCRIKDTSRGGFSYGKSRQLSTIKKRGKEEGPRETEQVSEGWANDGEV